MRVTHLLLKSRRCDSGRRVATGGRNYFLLFCFDLQAQGNGNKQVNGSNGVLYNRRMRQSILSTVISPRGRSEFIELARAVPSTSSQTGNITLHQMDVVAARPQAEVSPAMFVIEGKGARIRGADAQLSSSDSMPSHKVQCIFL